jgi:hypothetical protein
MASANPFNPPHVLEPVFQEDTGSFSPSWYQKFTQWAKALNAPVNATVPAAADASGTAGQIASDGTYLYLCVATNSWKRVPLTEF